MRSRSIPLTVTALVVSVFCAGLLPCATASSLDTASRQDWFPKAPPLPRPTRDVIVVNSVRELYAAIKSVKRGGTILVADGVYPMPRTLVLAVENVTLRGHSGDRTRVVLDFSNSRHHEGIAISRCSGVTVADLTVANVRQNGIKINSNLGVDRVTIYNVISHNVWQRHIKGPRTPDQDGKQSFVEDCRVEYCLFYNDRAKQRGDEPYEDARPQQFRFNYVGGIDVMGARGWGIANNVFLGIRGKTGEARGAVFLWHNTTNCVVERNIILDCDSGICLGCSSARGERRHANGVLVRNNFVVRCHESNILADHTRDCRIENNTVHDPELHNGRLLRVIHANDGLLVANNIFSGPRISVEKHTGEIKLQNNLIRPVGEYFVDPANGDLHLRLQATDAIDQAISSPKVTNDIDGQRRAGKPDLGADEWIRPAPQRVR